MCWLKHKSSSCCGGDGIVVETCKRAIGSSPTEDTLNSINERVGITWKSSRALVCFKSKRKRWSVLGSCIQYLFVRSKTCSKKWLQQYKIRGSSKSYAGVGLFSGHSSCLLNSKPMAHMFDNHFNFNKSSSLAHPTYDEYNIQIHYRHVRTLVRCMVPGCIYCMYADLRYSQT